MFIAELNHQHRLWKQTRPQLIYYMNEEIRLLKQKQIECALHADDTMVRIECANLPHDLSVTEVRRKCQYAICRGLSRFIVEVMEKHFVKQLLSTEFNYKDPQVLESIYDYCWQMLWMTEADEFAEAIRDDEKVRQRKLYIFHKAYHYLQNQNQMVLDGFVRFRLKDYILELKKVIEFAIEEYMLDEEFKEFIRLLRSFLAVQVSKVALLHVLHTGEKKFRFLDETGDIISDQEIEAQMDQFASQAKQQEEMVMSTLLTLAPRKIIVHTDTPSVAIIQTLQQIFEERMTVCPGCRQCRKWEKA